MAAKKSKRQPRTSNCPIAASSAKRHQADASTARIKDRFPPGIAQPALRALVSAGYTTLDQLSKVEESDLARLHGMGPKALRLLNEALEQRGKPFAE
jgi:hypothetical protein